MSRILSIVLFICFAGYTGYLLYFDFATADIRVAAKRLEIGQPVSEQRLQRLANSEAMLLSTSSCRPDILRPALTIKLYQLDHSNQTKDYNGWAAAHDSAMSLLSRMVKCMPSDANAFLRYGIVSRFAAADVDQLELAVATAFSLAPNEQQQVIARIGLWQSLSTELFVHFKTFARHDVQALFRYGLEGNFDATLSTSPTPFGKLVANELDTLPYAARNEIVKRLKIYGKEDGT